MKKLVFLSLLATMVNMAMAQSVESDALFAKGVEQYNQGHYRQAISFFEQSQAKDNLDPTMTEERLAYNTSWIASCHYRLGEEEQAQHVLEVDYHFTPVDRRLTRQSDSLVYVAGLSANAGEFPHAVSLMSDVIRLESTNLGKNSYFVANSTAQKAFFLFNSGNLAEAIKESEKSLSIYKNDADAARSYAYGCALNQHASMLLMNGQFNQAKAYASQSVTIIEKWKAASPGDLAVAYYNLANCESNGVVTDQAKQYVQKLADCLYRIPREQSIYYLDQFQFCADALMFYIQAEEALVLIDYYVDAVKSKPDFNQAYMSALYTRSKILNNLHHHQEALNDIQLCIASLEQDDTIDKNYLDEHYLQLGEILYTLNKFDEAIKAANETLRRSKKLSEDHTYQMIYANQLLANCYNAQSQGTQAIRMINDALKQAANAYSTDNRVYAGLLEHKANIVYNAQSLEASIDCLEQAAGIYERIGSTQECVNTLYNITLQYARNGKNQRKAIETALHALEINDRDQSAIKDVAFVEVLYILGSLYQGSGNTAKAQLYFRRAIEDCEKYGISGNMTQVKVNIAEARILSAEGDYAKAMSLVQEALDIAIHRTGPSSMESNEIRIFLAQIQSMMGDQNLAYSTIQEVEIFSDQGMLQVNSDGLMNLLSLYCNTWGYYDRTIEIYNQVRPYIEEYGSNDFVSMFDIYLVAAYALKGDWNSCAKNIVRPTEVMTNMVRSNFLTMSSEERMTLWNQASNYYSTLLPSFCGAAPDQTPYTPLAYNGVLMSKGLLLQTETSLSDIIEKKGSVELKETFRQLTTLKERFFRLNNQPNMGQDSHREEVMIESISLLQNEIEQMEHNVSDRVNAELGDFTSFLDITWTDIKKRLKNDEIAVEFVRYNEADGTGEAHYGALIVRHDSKIPQFLKLTSEQALSSVEDYSQLAELIWKPILESNSSVSTVYFSPDGTLYGLPIESLPEWSSSQLLSEKYAFYRLSSTRELVLKKERNRHKAAVYGGMNYDLSASQMIADTLNYQVRRNRSAGHDPLLRDNRESANVLQHLPGTQLEAEAIYQHLSSQIAGTSIYLGNDATELSLKSLSGSNLDILHIGTHGFYDSSIDFDSHALGSTSLLSPKEQEDIALSSTGLFFSGAQTFLNGTSLPEGVDDGILTALEISTLDFHGLDLVTLSACQTGQGDISSEGVFGLQRGFKKSGANTILMSLWNVDDAATQALMSEFYFQCMQGNNKHAALELAKQRVRNNDQWKDPEYWAAFILLDAL